MVCRWWSKEDTSWGTWNVREIRFNLMGCPQRTTSCELRNVEEEKRWRSGHEEGCGRGQKVQAVQVQGWLDGS